MSDLKRYFLFIILPLVLAVAYYVALQNSRNIAAALASVPYVPLSDEQARQAAAANSTPSWYGATRREPDAQAIAWEKSRHRLQYYHDHVDPLEPAVEVGINIGFGLLYLLVGGLAIRELRRWMQTRGVERAEALRQALGRGGRAIAQAADIDGLAARHRLAQVEKEVQRHKTLFENGLITEAEFNAKKAKLRARIESAKLVD